MNLNRLARRLALWGSAVALCAAGLVACGGATSRVDPFVPARLVVFGDEYSALLDASGTGNAQNYAINRVDSTTGQISCSMDAGRIWVQRLADHYGFAFAECNPNAAKPQAFMYAKYGAKVAALSKSIESFANRLDGGFTSDDLVTLQAGLHDVVEVYLDGNLTSEGVKTEEIRKRGQAYAALVNNLIQTGAKVLVAQVIDVGSTPWARSEGATGLLTRLSAAFNEGFRSDLINDGTRVGLLSFNDTVGAYMNNNSYEHYAVACDENHVEPVAVDDTNGDGYVDGGGVLATCTTNTLVADEALTRYIWADPLHVNASLIHVQMGNLAITRAVNNPFQN